MIDKISYLCVRPSENSGAFLEILNKLNELVDHVNRQTEAQAQETKKENKEARCIHYDVCSLRMKWEKVWCLFGPENNTLCCLHYRRDNDQQ